MDYSSATAGYAQLPLGLNSTVLPVREANEKRLGRVLTPEVVARVLCRWAIRSPTDLVLDLGVGEGVFALAACERLRELGTNQAEAAAQVHGSECDADVFERAQEARWPV